MAVGENFEPWVYLLMFAPPFLAGLVIIYYLAESQGESGFFWAMVCLFLPGVGFILYFVWVILKRMSDKRLPKPDRAKENTPDVALSRERLDDGQLLTAKGDYELDMLIHEGQWEEAEVEAKRILETAEADQDGPTIARMIGYMERIRKRKK